MSGFVSAANGSGHTLALKADGTVWAWGENGEGQLGDGTTIDRASPIQIAGLTNVVFIAAGNSSSYAVKDDGTVWAWGANYGGQLGDGTKTLRRTPVQVSGMTNAVALSAGLSHAVAIKADGSAWAWGSNTSGQLGDGTTTTRLIPVQVVGITDAASVSAGVFHTAIAKTDGSVWTWGANFDGQLGDGTLTRRTSPTLVPGLTGIVEVTCGSLHSLALKNDGSVWGWGANYFGQLGTEAASPQLQPLCINGLVGIAISAGSNHSIALKADGGVVGLGDNSTYQLGSAGPMSSFSTPVQVTKIRNASAVSHQTHVLVLTDEGKVFYISATGSAPMQIVGPVGVTSLSTGASHSAVVDGNGKIWIWGGNSNGQLGDGSTTSKAAPFLLGSLDNITSVSAGSFHTLALRSDGTIWGWGANTNGALGDGTTTQRSVPIQIPGLANIIEIAAGSGHSVALKSDGTVWTWGANSEGQLGDGSTTRRLAPVQVTGLSAVVSIAACENHTLALKSDGTVVAWGYNGFGQLGDGTFAFARRTAPVGVVGLSGVTAISTGIVHSMALRSDGTVWAWGLNTSGQVGDGTNIQRTSPVQVLGNMHMGNIASIGAGYHRSLAISERGTIWGWGDNPTGVLFNAYTSPTPIAIRTIPVAADTNQNYIDDSAELAAFGSLAPVAGADDDGDGLANFAELIKGSPPSAVDGDADLLTDIVDPYPFDYYNNVAPGLVVMGGNNQVAPAGQFNAAPFDLAVFDELTFEPLVNAPVTFTVTAGGGGVVRLLTDTLAGSVNLRTDEFGSVQVYFKQPNAPGFSSAVTAVAGGAMLNINTKTGDLSVDYDLDYDGDGIPNGWEVENGMDPYVATDAATIVAGLTNLQRYLQSLSAGGDPLTANALGLVVYSP